MLSSILGVSGSSFFTSATGASSFRGSNVRVGVLTGPSHAEEVAIAIPTVLVIASHDEEILSLIQDTFMSEKMRVYTSDDVKGVELGGALKNIIAFCAGIVAELDMGDNTFAALLTVMILMQLFVTKARNWM